MMLLHLVKKDFILTKKYVLMLLAVCIIIPLFAVWRVPDYAGFAGLVLSIVFAVFMLLQNVSLKESQFPKASALLCAMPYKREYLVLSKYIFCFIIFVSSCLLFAVEALIVPTLGGSHVNWMVVMFLVFAIFIGTYLPMQYKFGFEKTKFFYYVVIMAVPFLLPQFLKMNQDLHFDFLSTIAPVILYSSIIAISFVILTISTAVSIHIYNRKDLA